MMYKVSFYAPKGVEHYNNKVTEVTIKGILSLPKELPYESDKTKNWRLHSQNWVNTRLFAEDISIWVKGYSKCSDEDAFDPVKGERIAEARAKIKLYTFMHNYLLQAFGELSMVLYGRYVIPNDAKKLGEYSILYDAAKYLLLKKKEEKHLKELIDDTVTKRPTKSTDKEYTHSLWHNTNEFPEESSFVMAYSDSNDEFYTLQCFHKIWKDTIKNCNISSWAYMTDYKKLIKHTINGDNNC